MYREEGDVGISLITISITGRAQSTGLECLCTGGQKPQEEDGKEKRKQGDERRNDSGENE